MIELDNIYPCTPISGYNCHSMYWHRYLYPYLDVLVDSGQGFLKRVEGGRGQHFLLDLGTKMKKKIVFSS